MSLGELIAKYCAEHSISQQSFAKQIHKSKAYISMLVNNRNPKTGRPIAPTVETYAEIADAMGMTLNELFNAIDDAPVTINTGATDDELWQMREEMRRNPELRVLFDLQRNATKSELKQMAAFIRAIRSNDHEDDPA